MNQEQTMIEQIKTLLTQKQNELNFVIQQRESLEKYKGDRIPDHLWKAHGAIANWERSLKSEIFDLKHMLDTAQRVQNQLSELTK